MGNGGEKAGAPVVRCRGLWKIFGSRHREALAAIRNDGAGKQQVFEQYGCVVGVAGASFDVGEGEIFCIMGLSGSGKSTLIRHINRLIEPTAGDIFIEDVNISELSADAMRDLRARKIGMVFQNMALLPHRNARDNVALPLEIRGVDKSKRQETADRALAAVNLGGWGGRYPDELSGGMQQRVGLARALAADPSILLMDEPFSALDPLIRRQLQNQFLQLAATMRKTTIFITHDLDEAIRIGNRIAIMKDGVLVQIGTPEEIVTAPADDYVADFVAGISKLELITARRIMEPAPAEAAGAEWATASPEANLNELVDISVTTPHPILIQRDGDTLGVVTQKALLRGIQGRIEGGAERA